MAIPIVLTIAGSDCGGGAGIQADLKTFSALKVYGCTVITAITAQNTLGVQYVDYLSSCIVKQQCESIFSDFKVSGIKIGMLGSKEIVEAIANFLETLSQSPFIVIDPVMISTTGDPLISDDAIEIIQSRLFPKANLLTPNLHEAVLMSGKKIPMTMEEEPLLLMDLWKKYQCPVLLKGGHLKTEKNSIDWLFDGKKSFSFSLPRVDTLHTHGTGCSLSAAITAFYAHKHDLQDAVNQAKKYVHDGIVNANLLRVGKGKGPIHHFAKIWNR